MSSFVCKECGAEFASWMGKCSVCSSWDSLTETAKITKTKKDNFSRFLPPQKEAQLLTEVSSDVLPRISTGIGECDNVLGGGIQKGSVCLVAGEPGIGKSTLMLQVASEVSKGRKVLYVSTEESESQIKSRGHRLGLTSQNLLILCSNSQENIIEKIEAIAPDLLVIDSIQAVSMLQNTFQIGHTSLLRQTTFDFVQIAKTKNISTFLVGHITKDGAIAGPKIIEHMVDTVLYFETTKLFRILRTTKNRFGSTNEIGIFKMNSTGLEPVGNPSGFFLSGNENVAGLSKGAVVEGTRVFLVEVQTLVTPSNFANPQRIAIGIDPKRFAMLLAIMEKKMSANLRQKDVFLNLAGGMKATDTSIDLSCIASVISSIKEKPLDAKTIFMGEVDLNGQIRPVTEIDKKAKEAKRMGFKTIIGSYKQKNPHITGLRNIWEIAQML